MTDVSSVGKDKNNISNTQEKREINSNKIYRQYTKEEIKEKIGDKLTNSNYHLIRQINPLLSVLFSSKVPEQLPYRDVFKTPTLEDYYIGTKAKFTSIGAEPAGTDYQSLTGLTGQ